MPPLVKAGASFLLFLLLFYVVVFFIAKNVAIVPNSLSIMD